MDRKTLPNRPNRLRIRAAALLWWVVAAGTLLAGSATASAPASTLPPTVVGEVPAQGVSADIPVRVSTTPAAAPETFDIRLDDLRSAAADWRAERAADRAVEEAAAQAAAEAEAAAQAQAEAAAAARRPATWSIAGDVPVRTTSTCWLTTSASSTRSTRLTTRARWTGAWSPSTPTRRARSTTSSWPGTRSCRRTVTSGSPTRPSRRAPCRCRPASATTANCAWWCVSPRSRSPSLPALGWAGDPPRRLESLADLRARRGRRRLATGSRDRGRIAPGPIPARHRRARPGGPPGPRRRGSGLVLGGGRGRPGARLAAPADVHAGPLQRRGVGALVGRRRLQPRFGGRRWSCGP